MSFKVERDEISLREFIVRRHQKKAVKEPYEEKGLSADEFYRLVLKTIISQRLVGSARQKKERKNHAACVLVLCCLTRVISGKIIEHERYITFGDFWSRTSSCRL